LKESTVIPSNIVMEKYIEPAMDYYREILDKIKPYFFYDNLIKMVGFQQLIISSQYQIEREDARSKKGIDYIRECVSKINKPIDLVNLMESWYAFDLCLTAPSFVNPTLASNIRKRYCLIGSKYFDCKNCNRIACRENLIWNESTIVFDLDTNGKNLDHFYNRIKEELNSLEIEHAIKLSSLNGFHVNIGLPKDSGKTIFDRSIYNYCIAKELIERGIPIDDNSLDPIPIIRAPFSLHYKRLTPSLPVNDEVLYDAIEILTQIENDELENRIEYALKISKGWYVDWMVKNSKKDSFENIIRKWYDEAQTAIFREKRDRKLKKTNVGDYLRKGSSMTIEDENIILKLLLKEGKSEDLAKKIIELNKKKSRREKKPKEFVGDLLLKTQKDIPNKIIQIPPPIVVLIIDNATINDIQTIIGIPPIKVESLSNNTDEGFNLLFKKSKLLKFYPRKWNCRSIYIGGLYSSYNYCASADLVIAVKMKNVWDRDMKILEELDKKIYENKKNLIVAHLLGLDFCKDNNLKIEGAIIIFKKLLKEILSTDNNIVITTDHSGEKFIPYFELITKLK